MWRFEFTVVADLTANIFAACFVIFLMLSAVPFDPAAGRSEASDLASTLRLAPREALSGADLVDLLYDWGAGSSQLSVALFADGAEIAGVGRFDPASLDAAVAAAIRADRSGPPPLRVGLYVFSNAHYQAVLDAVAAHGGTEGLTIREIDVPAALRLATAPDRNWSPRFLALSQARLDRQAFVAGLAALLEAGPASTGAPAAGGAAAAPAPGGASAPALLARLGAAIGAILAVAMPILAALLVLATEARFRRTG